MGRNSWAPRRDNAHAWQHDLCFDTTVFQDGVNPNRPWRRCPQCGADTGSWSDAGVAGTGDTRTARG